MNKWPLSCNVALALCQNLWVYSSLCRTALLTLKAVLQLSVALAAPSRLPFSPMDSPPSRAHLSPIFACTAYSDHCSPACPWRLKRRFTYTALPGPPLPAQAGGDHLLTDSQHFTSRLHVHWLVCVCAFPSDLTLFWYKDKVMYLCIPHCTYVLGTCWLIQVR